MTYFEAQVLLALGVEPATVERAVFVGKIFNAKIQSQNLVGQAESGLATNPGATEEIQGMAQIFSAGSIGPVGFRTRKSMPRTELDPAFRDKFRA